MKKLDRPLLAQPSRILWLLPEDIPFPLFLSFVSSLYTILGLFFLESLTLPGIPEWFRQWNDHCKWFSLRVRIVFVLPSLDVPHIYTLSNRQEWYGYVPEQSFHIDSRPLRLWKSNASWDKKKMIVWMWWERNERQLFFMVNYLLWGYNRESPSLYDMIDPELRQAYARHLNALFDLNKTCCAFRNVTNTLIEILDVPKIQSVSEIDWDAYTGSWTQVYAGPLSIAFVEQFGCSNEATYTLSSDAPNTILIENQQTTIFGNLRTVQGIGRIIRPGQLKVRFSSSPVEADYWIVALGPLRNQQYQWAIVSDPLRVSLFVLARQRLGFFQKYKTQVLEQLQELGFSYVWNSPVETH